MYNGNEKLILNDVETQYSMLGFWQWAYSNITLNMNRGTFAEYIVKCAMHSGGFNPNVHEKTGLEPFDLTGPVIPSLNRNARVEVKSSAFIQEWRNSPTDKANFSIDKAKLPDETGDYPHDAVSQRNNDLYVFCLYTADSNDCNILDLKWWRFYVYPTYKIDEDKVLSKQKTISLVKINRLGIKACEFDNLYENIEAVISDISNHFSNEGCQ